MAETKTLVFLSLLAVAGGLSYSYFFLDDAFISLRYAENLAVHGELAYNPGERVEGVTNIGYTLLLAAVGAFRNPLVYVKLISLAGLVASVLLIYKITGNKWVAALLAIDGFYTAWASDGMETSLFIAMLLGAVLLAERGKFGSAGFLLGISTWFRLDGILFALLMYLKHRDRGIAYSLIPFAALEGFRLLYYGSLIPNTYFAKFALYNILVPLWKKPVMVAVKAAVMGVIYFFPLREMFRKMDVLAIFPVALFALYSTSPVGGLRYLVYGVPIMFLFLKRVPKWYFAWTALISLALHVYLLQQGAGMAVFDSAGREIAEMNNGTAVAVADAGLLGFHQKNTEVFDVLGLNSRESTGMLWSRDFQGICDLIDSKGIRYVALSQDDVSLAVESCLDCRIVRTAAYPPLSYENASLKIYDCW